MEPSSIWDIFFPLIIATGLHVAIFSALYVATIITDRGYNKKALKYLWLPGLLVFLAVTMIIMTTTWREDMKEYEFIELNNGTLLIETDARALFQNSMRTSDFEVYSSNPKANRPIPGS